MSTCGFDQWLDSDQWFDSNERESSKQSFEITSEELRLMLNDNKTRDYVSDVIGLFARHGTIQDVNAFLAHHEKTDPIDEVTVPGVLLNAICHEERQDLLEHMVSLGFKPHDTCMTNVLFKKNNSMVDYLLSIDCEMHNDVLRYVSDVTIAIKLILHGAEVNPKLGPFRVSPLQSQIMHNRIDIALLLISMNAEVNETIVNLALKNGNPQLIEAVQSRV